MNDKILFKGNFLSVTETQYNNKPWELLHQPNGVAGIVLDEDDNILLVRQYRVPLQQELFEIPAGCMDVEGEHPASCLARELEEEALMNISASQFRPIIQYFPLAGCCDSEMKLYVTRIRGKRQFEAKKNDTDADVREIIWMPFNEFEQYFKSQKLKDGKTIMAYLYLKALMKNGRICLDYIDEYYPQKYKVFIYASECVLCNTVRKNHEVHIVEYYPDTKICFHFWFAEKDYTEVENFIQEAKIFKPTKNSAIHYKQIKDLSELQGIISQEEIDILNELKEKGTAKDNCIMQNRLSQF